MITPYLEKLIWEGKAAIRTWATGGAGVTRIPVKKNSFIVVVGITYHPFLDTNATDTWSDARFNFQECGIHSLFMYTGKIKHLMNFRDWYTISSGISGALVDKTIPVPGKPFFKPCYLIFDENVRVNILRNDNQPSNWVNPDFGTIPSAADTDELDIPEGYQTAAGGFPQNTLKTWRFATSPVDSAIYPLADTFTLAPVTRAHAHYQYQQKNGGALVNPISFGAAATQTMLFPLINFDYVEVQGILPSNMAH